MQVYASGLPWLNEGNLLRLVIFVVIFGFFHAGVTSFYFAKLPSRAGYVDWNAGLIIGASVSLIPIRELRSTRQPDL